MGASDSHGAIRAMLAERTPCKVLDAAAGTGALCQFLVEAGWDVHATDIDEDNFQIEGVPFTKSDLNRELPFEDESFDAIVFANAIHRLFNPAGAIREFFRILRPEGRLYVNANNFAAIDLRLRFLLLGSIEYHHPELWSKPAAVPEEMVRNHITYPQIAGYLEASGFDILGVHPAAVRLRHRLLTPLAWIVRAATYLIPKGTREKNHVSVTSSGAILSGGYYVLIEAAKT
jgi:SAM-dependent methyltransferase